MIFFPPSPLTIRSVRVVKGEEEEEEKEDERVEWRNGDKTVKRGENTEEMIKEKCGHGVQNADKRHKTLHLHVLNSPLSLFLSMDSYLESLDCGWLLSNQNPVETVSERPTENTIHDESGPPNRYNQSGCLCLTVFYGMLVVTIKIHQLYNLHRPTEIYLYIM